MPLFMKKLQRFQLAISDHKARAMKMLDVNEEFTTASAALTTSMRAWLKEKKDHAEKTGTAQRMPADDHARGLAIESIKYHTQFSDYLFSQRSLERAGK